MEASMNKLLLAHIRNGMTELVMLLRVMGPGQLQGLSQFVNPNGWVELNLAMLDSMLRQSTDETLMGLVDLGNKFVDGLVVQNSTNQDQKQQDFMQFVQLYHLWCLQQMIRETSFEQLLKLFDLLANKSQMEQLHLLDDFKTLLSQLDKDTLHSLHSEISEISRDQPGTEAKHLPDLITFESQHFHLYDPLRQLLQLPLEQFLSLSDMLPQWGIIQLLLLTRLRESGAYDVSDYTALLAPEKFSDQPTVFFEQPPPTVSATPALMLSILEQPPAKCVYKRNVKPAPTVVIEGDQSANDGNLYIVPVLIRCDTLDEEPKLLTGNTPQKITATRTVAFKSLKILTTSHKMNETLFSFQFELRRYNGNTFEVVHKVVSNPILVLSHSTQLKVSPKLLPTVTEVIPFGGPESGGTRVAILGSGFCDSPTVRVKFDHIEVMPIFHGAKTLIVSTPQHEPGTVEVRVCNDLNSWSESTATYTYYSNSSLAQSPTTATTSEFGFGSTSSTSPFFDPNSAGFSDNQMDLSDFGSPTGLNSGGFNTLHYAVASGDLLQTKLALRRGIDPNIQDKRGNSALHWAVMNSHYSIVLLLLSLHFQQQNQRFALCKVNIRNQDGETPLHWAVKEGNCAIAELLIKRGANVKQQDNLGLSPLHVACAIGSVELVCLLLSYGAFQSRTLDGLLPLHLACLGGHSDVAKTILRFDNKATINAMDDEGNSPLHCAVASGDVETVKALIEPLAEAPQIHVKTLSLSKTYASPQQKEQELLRQLLLDLETQRAQEKAEEMQEEPTKQQFTLLQPSSMRNQKESTLLNRQNSEGETPLLMAIALSYFAIAQLLIEHGAEVNKLDYAKNTPAHAAVMKADAEFISYLIASGADFHIPNSAGDTAYSLALLLEEKTIAWMLPTKKRKVTNDCDSQSPVKKSKSEPKETQKQQQSFPQVYSPFFTGRAHLEASQMLISVL